jgi:hypothetical protein
VAKHEGEINELLQEYWTMRRQAGESASACSPQAEYGVQIDADPLQRTT